MFEEPADPAEKEPPSYIDAHTHSWQEDDGVVRIRNLFPDAGCESHLPPLFSLGIHPGNLDENSVEEELLRMEQILSARCGCIAVGECGLDHFAPASAELQEQAFIRHIELALKYHLPVIVHAVRTWPEIIRIKNQLAPDALWLAHGFRSSPETAEELLRHHILLSFGAVLPEDERGKEILAGLPEETFLLETDESPLPVQDLYTCAAGVRNVSVSELRKQTAAAFESLFGFPPEGAKA